MKLQTRDEWRFGNKVSLPDIGDVEVSIEGYIEIENEAAAYALHNMNIGFYLLDKDTAEVENIQPKAHNTAPLDDSNEEDLTNIFSVLDGMTLSDLKKYAAEHGLPRSEWSSLNKESLLEYIKELIS